MDNPDLNDDPTFAAVHPYVRFVPMAPDPRGRIECRLCAWDYVAPARTQRTAAQAAQAFAEHMADQHPEAARVLFARITRARE